jgi:hypothetical protein
MFEAKQNKDGRLYFAWYSRTQEKSRGWETWDRSSAMAERRPSTGLIHMTAVVLMYQLPGQRRLMGVAAAEQAVTTQVSIQMRFRPRHKKESSKNYRSVKQSQGLVRGCRVERGSPERNRGMGKKSSLMEFQGSGFIN